MHKVLRRVFETKYREGGENHAVGGGGRFVICFVTEQAIDSDENKRVRNVLREFLSLIGRVLFDCRYKCTATKLIQAHVQYSVAERHK
jgi:hypothetical protein